MFQAIGDRACPSRRPAAPARIRPALAAMALLLAAAPRPAAADLQVFASNEVSTVLAGATSVYAVTVTNSGAAAESAVAVAGIFDAAHFESLQWTCLPEFPAGHLGFGGIRSGVPGAEGLLAVGDGLLYASSPATDSIAAFSRTPATGALAVLGTKQNGALEGDGDRVAGLDGVLALAASPDGAFLYAVSPVEDAVVVLRIAAGGLLDWVEMQRDGAGGVDGLDQAGSLVVTAGHVYVGGASDDAVAIFSRDEPSGRLTYLGKVFDGQLQGALAVDGLDGAAALVASPGGEHLYVAGANDHAVALFDRDAATGALTFRRSYGAAEAPGLAGVHSLALAADGASLYAAGSSTLVVLPRTLAPGGGFGELGAPLQTIAGGPGGLAGMATPRQLALSADGAYLYLSSPADHGVLAFVRDHRGRLAFLERRTDGAGLFDGLAGAAGLALSPDGGHLYVAGAGDGALAVLPRDRQTHCAAGGEDDTVATPALELQDVAGLGPGARLHYRVAARLRSAALGFACAEPYDPGRSCVAATASLAYGGGAAESTDIDYLSRQADLAISSSDGLASAVPGESLVYSIAVDNLGPSDAAGLELQSFFPAAIESVAWTCAGTGAGATCGQAAGAGDVSFGGSLLPAGGRLLLTATALLESGARGAVQQTARVIAPPGLLDPDAANNTASDGDTLLAPVAELAVTAAGLPPFYAGAPIVFELAVENHGPSDAFGVAVAGLLPGIVADPAFACETPTVAGAPSLLATTAVLPGPAGGAVSPDGAHLYLASHGGGALQVLRRDLDGRLTALATIADGDAWSDPVDGASGAVSGLIGARAVAVSADGRHVYLASDVDDGVVFFRRDALTGRLIFEAAYRDGQGGIAGLGGAAALAFSPAGDHLYVAGTADHAVAIFGRDTITGFLSFLGAVEEGIGGVAGLLGVTALATSADGRHLYAASPGAGGIAVFTREAGGLLGFLETFATTPALAAGSGLAASADGLNLYAVAGAADTLLVLRRDAAPASPGFGRLTQLAALAEGGLYGGVAAGGLAGARGVALSADGRQVFTRGAGAVGVYARAVDELVAPGEPPGRLACRDLGGGSCSAPVAGSGDAGLFAFAAENLYLPDGAAGQVAVLGLAPGSRCLPQGLGQVADSIDLLAGDTVVYRVSGRVLSSASGAVELSAAATPGDAADPGAWPNTAAASEPILLKSDLALAKSDGVTTAIAGLPLTYALTVTNQGPSDLHGVTLEDVYPLYPAPPGGFAAGSLTWSCSGASAVALPQQLFDGVAGSDGLAGALDLAASDDGAHLYVAGQNEDAVAIFARAPSGELTFLSALRDGAVQAGGTVAGLGGASGIAVSPGGGHVYVTGEAAGSVVVLARDAASGGLAFLRSIAAGIDGLRGAAGVVVSADGRHVYVSGKDDGTVVVFRRDPASGDLAFLERERDGFGNVPQGSLLGARDLHLSASGGYLLVAAQQSDALVVFRRDPADGSLDFLRAVHDGDPQGEVAIDGLDMVFSLAASPDGRFLYTAALADDAIARFAWSEATGELSYLGHLKNGSGGASHLDGASAVAVSADGRYLFATAANSDALSVFARAGEDGGLERLELLRQGEDGIAALDDPRGLWAGDGGIYASAASGALLSLRLAPRSVCGSAGALGETPSPFALDAGASVVLTATGTVHPSARGNCDGDGGDLVSPLRATLPPGVLDETLPNEAIDGDDLRGQVGLALTLTDNQVSVAAGTPIAYTATITNSGAPSDSIGARATAAGSASLLDLAWTCSGAAGASCGAAAGSGPLDVELVVPLGGSVTVAITGRVSAAATGTVSQTVTLSPGPCETDLAPADNGATDRNAVIRVADLAISKSGPLEAEPGSIVFYDIVARNLGPSDGEGTVTDLLPPQLLRAVWSCMPSGGAQCPLPPSGSGNLAAAVVLPLGSEVTFTVAAEVAMTALGTLGNTALLAPSAAVIDALQANNSSTATLELLDVVIFHDGFESGDTAAWEVFGLAGTPDAQAAEPAGEEVDRERR